NYLIPYGKAVPATPENRAKFEARRAELERVQQEALTRARERAEKLDGFTVPIVRKVAEDGTMYGSVTNRDIAEAVQQAGFEVERSEIELPHGPLKTIGDHDIAVRLHPEVTARIIVSVIGEP